MKKYYILRYNSLNLKETGTQFQSIDGVLGDIQQDFIPFEGKIDFPFKLPEPFLQKKAKPTTFLNVIMIPAQFLVFKNYFIDFLKGFDIGEFQTWDLKVHQNGNIINDYDLFIISDTYQRQLIDFDKSDFFVGDFLNYDLIGDSIQMEDYDKYVITREELNKKNKLLKYKKVILNLSNIEMDLFRISNTPASGYYVSEKLKNAIEKEKFTGFAFQEIEDMDNRIEVVY